MKSLEFSKIKNTIGVEVKNFDSSLELSSDIIIQIQELLNEFKLVVFRNQQLTDKQLCDFAFHFGSPFFPDNNFPVLGSQDSHSPVVVIGNQANEYPKSYLGFQEVLPHSDHQWLKCPSAASMLYAIDIQCGAATTIWYDMVDAYNTLDEDTRTIIHELNIITYNPFYRPFGSVVAKYVNRADDIPPGAIFPHPLARTHPFTQKKILYLNLAYEIEFEKMAYEEGNELFKRLYSHVLSQKSKYEHHWNNGDLVFWDNRATIHYRPSFDSNVRRVLKRISLGGEIPF